MTKQYKYYDFIMAAFVTVLVTSNLIGPAKVAQIEAPLLGILTFGAGVLFYLFPLSLAIFLPKSMATLPAAVLFGWVLQVWALPA